MSESNKSIIPYIAAAGISSLIGYTIGKLSQKKDNSIKEKEIEKQKSTIKGMPVEIKPDNVFHVPHLREIVGEKYNKHVPNIKWKKSNELNRNIPLRNYQSDRNVILYDIVQKFDVNCEDDGENPDLITTIKDIKGFVRSGPRAECWFSPPDINVALCTTGGLCPGLNNIIRGITNALLYTYGVHSVLGVRDGFLGFYQEPILLTSDYVRYVNEEGGSCIGSNRGHFDKNVIIDWLVRHNVHALFIIGGDGSHRAANILYEEVKERKLNISIAGVPKTIDNDIAFIDRSFGFDTAVEEAAKVYFIYL